MIGLICGNDDNMSDKLKKLKEDLKTFSLNSCPQLVVIDNKTGETLFDFSIGIRECGKDGKTHIAFDTEDKYKDMEKAPSKE